MLSSVVTAVLGMSAILGAWLAVQVLWARFGGAKIGDDALAGRLGCQGCGCETKCSTDKQNSGAS